MTGNKTSNQLPETILIIDDNIANLEVAQKILSDARYETILAKSGSEALEILNVEKPDLILLDIMMPGITGFDVCRRIKINPDTTDIPIIFLTALNQSEDLVRGFDLGAADYITKPFSKDVLITRVRNQIEIIKKNKIIIEQNKHLINLNNEKNGLLEIAAHDLKNPLTAIMGSAELLSKNIDKRNPALKIDLLDNIRSSAKKAINIIQDLLEVQALEEGRLHLNNSAFDARDAALEVVEEFLYAANQKQIILNFEEDEKECKIYADKKKLNRIIDNLISNAIKFSNIGSTVTVKCLLTNLTKSEKVVQISVTDEGPGFSQEDMSKLFTKFAKLSAKPTGDESSTGLGLSIVKKMTELMGGIVELRTEIGNGTTFIISFIKYN